MATESIIFETPTENKVEIEGFYGFKLLRTNTHTSLYHALKGGKRFIIKTTKDNSEHQVTMLHREYELSIQCEHPHIVHMYTFERNLPFGVGIVMEYIEGRTLREYLAEKPSASERLRIYKELLSAVGYLHKRGIIHNDLKPENALVTYADNTLKLIDFGLADSDAEYALSRLGCTMKYASPELQNRSIKLDARSDIYSLGLLLREMLGNSYSRITTRCVKVNPEKRYSNVEALLRAIEWRQKRWMRVFVLISILFMLLPTLLYTTKIEIQHIAVQYDSVPERIIDTIVLPPTVAEPTHPPTPTITVAPTIPSTKHNREERRNKILAKIDRTLDSLSAITLDSVRRETYFEFGTMHILTLSERCLTFRDQLLASEDDPQLLIIYTTHFNKAYENCFEAIIEANVALPSFYEQEDPDMLKFYNSLIENRLPFQPYNPEETQDNKRQF